MTTLHMTVESRNGKITKDFEILNLIIAGWAGRDKEATEHHILELEALGVTRPISIPTYYRVAASRLTTADFIEDTGRTGSGEVEAVLFSHQGHLYIGVGSDHTDRKVETYSVTVSKQMCDKPVASTVWPFAEVANHWDELMLRSHAVIDGKRVLYQEGLVSGLLLPADLISGWSESSILPDSTAMFGGTIPAIGGVRPATRFEGELEDPILQRKIIFGYHIQILPVIG